MAEQPGGRPTPSGNRVVRRPGSGEHPRAERPLGAARASGEGRVAVEEVVPAPRNERIARVFNATLAGAGLVLLLPLLLLIALLVRVTSPGPILYAQARVGVDRRWRETLALRERRLEDLGGQVFTIFKFRTMRVDAERASGAVWASRRDPRVTPIGRYLRQFRLDELPQLWNILVGDMNIVGPRPERPSIVARLREDIPEYAFRHRVKPGLTGLAQINQKYDETLEDVRGKVRWDLTYLRAQSLWLDVRIMLATVPSVLGKMRGW